MVGFLLQFCADCISQIKDTIQRSQCIQIVVNIIDNSNYISIMNILKYPYRVRQYILNSQKNSSIKLKNNSNNNSNSNSSSNLSSSEMGNYLIKKPEKYNARVMKYLGSVIPEYQQQTVENLNNTVVVKPIQENLNIQNNLQLQDNIFRTGSVSNVNYSPSPILFSPIFLPMEEIVSWEMVTDENLEKILQNENNLIEEMQGQDDESRGMRGGKEVCGRKRNILVESVKNRKKYCGLNIIHSSDTPHTLSRSSTIDTAVNVNKNTDVNKSVTVKLNVRVNGSVEE